MWVIKISKRKFKMQLSKKIKIPLFKELLVMMNNLNRKKFLKMKKLL